MNKAVIYVENFPLETSEIRLRNLFKKFGAIKNIDLPTFEPEHPLCKGLPKPKTKGYAFVEFQTNDQAKAAYDYFNDLRNIIPSEDDIHSEVDGIRKEIFESLEFKDIRNLRVMSKQTFVELSQNFHEQRFQSLVKVAKLFFIA